ncbi:hypothetical protein B5807_00169 [Epicoccum nigrum]|uniref:Uncharacterized protein n=1 Tax=Epicoccum nigrum TaxID=105696 RepID=A0A1Y2MBR1_EPING|nr:hypothetical protein B5807_00169 [Epicoccum nigrum]
MSSYSSARSEQLHPGYQPQSQQQRARSYSNPPYPITPGSAPYPRKQDSGYFPPPPSASIQQAPPTSNPISIPVSNRKRSSSDFVHGYASLPSHPSASFSYSNSHPTQPLQPIPQDRPIPGSYQYPSQQQHGIASSSPGYENQGRRSFSSQYGHDSRRSYESADSYQSAHSQPSPDYYVRQTYPGHHHDHHHHAGRENLGHGHGHANAKAHAPGPPKDYGDWDESEVSKYHKDQALERRPTIGGSLMSLVKKFGGSERH